jgi:alcohol dehydrogenase
MAGGSRIKALNGERVGHHSGLSCMAEYAVVDRGSVVVIDKSMPLAQAALFGCAVMTGVGAVVNTARIRPGDTVAVVGLGGVGLNGIMGARLAGAQTIIAIDLEPAKLEIARQIGATHAICARDADCVERVRDLTDGGVDYAFELGGSVDAMKTAYAIVRHGSSGVIAGCGDVQFRPGRSRRPGEIDRGSYMGSCAGARHPALHSFVPGGCLPVDRLIDGYIGFDRLNEGFDQPRT